MSAVYLKVDKLSGKGIILIAARHNLREIQAEMGADSHIDPARSSRNLRLSGPATAAAVADLASNAMRDAGIVKLRADAVRMVEVMVSLPENAKVDLAAFFADSLAWIQTFFAVPVLSAIVHLDETAPHLHVLLLPLLNGRMQGSDLVGNKTRLQTIQGDFYESVACLYGFARARPKKKPNKALRNKAAGQALDYMQSHPECLQLPNVCFALSEALAANPEPVMLALGLEMPCSKAQPKITGKEAVTRLMTRPCKPEPKQKPIGLQQRAKQAKPIGFEPAPAAANIEPYPCVGFANSSAVSDAAQSACPDLTHHPDSEQAGVWDEMLGEFIQIPAKAQGNARAWAKNEARRLGM